MPKATYLMVLFLCLFFKSHCQSISAGANNCYVICAGGIAYAYGNNLMGQLGNGINNGPVSNGVQVGNLTNITAVSSGTLHVIYLKADGTVWACGFNASGQLGDGTFVKKSIPVQIPTLQGITGISSSNSSSLFLKNDGTVWACGLNTDGQLGINTLTNTATPTLVNIDNVGSIATAANYTLFLKNDGTVWATGNNANGVFGNGTTVSSAVPVQLPISGVSKIAAGTTFSMFLKNDGTVWVSGWNFPTGNGLSSGTSLVFNPVAIEGVTAISAGSLHSAYLKNDGTVWTAGQNDMGQLGIGTFVSSYVLTQIPGASNVNEISANADSTLFKDAGASVWVSGFHTGGMLYQNTNLPVALINFCTAMGIADHQANSVKVYPNPNTGSFYIEQQWANADSIAIYNAIGQLVVSQILKDASSKIELSNASKGFYFYVTQKNGRAVSCGKILVE
ncbi:MAG TPA: T9SS type A sorting domain-containing protein [Flavobacterium sp.]|nr:T9SS type A sorting domain-containing protein [Flavobacterium sp.]